MSLDVYLGIDVGSVTTKLALVDEKGKYIDGELVVTYVYETIPDTGVYASDYSVVVSVMSIAIFMTLVFFKKKMFN